MDDSRTRHTLDALADLYLTGKGISRPSAAAPASDQQQQPPSYSAANTGPQNSGPVRLSPKLRVAQQPQPAAAAVKLPQNDNNQNLHASWGDKPAAGPARPWKEVRQERRAQQAAMDESPAQDDGLDTRQDADLADTFPGNLHTFDHDDVQMKQEPEDDFDSEQDHPPLMFPPSASRSSEIASTGVMTDDASDEDLHQQSRRKGSGSTHHTLHGEAVFLGNLPGFGGPWLAQYAQLLAVHKQRVAIVHMTGNHAEVDIISPLGAPAAAKADHEESIIDLFERLAGDRQFPLTQWLVHLPMPLTQAGKMMGHDLDHWTLITGSDDAATAAAGQWLMRMLEGDRRTQHRVVGASVMGSDPSRGQDVCSLMDQVAQGQLGDPVSLRPARRQMAPVNIQTLGSVGLATEVWPDLSAYLQSLEGTTSTQHALDVADTWEKDLHPAAAQESEDAFTLPDYRRVSAASAFDDGLKPAPTKPAPAKAAASTPEPAPSAEPVSASAPSQGMQPAADADESVVDYSRWIVPGSLSLEARSPYKPSVQLALDPQGRLHLMAGTLTQPGVSLQALALELLEARQWASDHLSLLSMTQRQCRFDLDAEPVIHLFTEDGIAAVAMLKTIGSSMKMHLAQQAHIGSQSTWVASPLN